MNPKARVLLADDDEGMLELVSAALGRAGYAVDTAPDGAAAVELARAGRYDLAVLDIQMPVMDGVAALGELKRVDPELEVIMATGHGDMATAVQSLRKGAFDYLHKPYQIKDLLAVAERALARRRFGELGRAVFSTLRTDELPAIVTGSAASALGADEAALLLDRGRGMETAFSEGLEEGPGREARLAFYAGLAPGAAGRPLTVLENPEGAPGLRTLLLLALPEGGGLLALARRREAPFSEDDLQRARVFGSLAGLALRNARLYSQLQETQAQLVQAEKMSALGQLAGGLAHEINNPLSGILGLAQLALEAVPAGTQTHDDLKEIEKAVFRCKKIIASLLSFARQEKARFEPVSVNEAVEETLVLCARQLQLQGVKVVKELSPELPCARGDFQQLMQVFLNLFTNARDAMPGGGELRVATARDGGLVRVTVSDTGAGIPPELLPRIFDPFYTTKPAGKGTGLGLSVCLGLVKKHGGEIKVSSRPGEGTAFAISLTACEE